jgi:hypothetical protein
MNKELKDFAAFILTHGRPDNVATYDALIKGGYTGRIVLVCDDEDPALDKYKAKYGDESVAVFSKSDYTAAANPIWDVGDNSSSTKAVVYARNAAYDIAERLGIKYFMQLDDDYSHFQYRTDDKFKYVSRITKSLDGIFVAMLKYYKSVPNMKSLAMAQGGDFIGGEANAYGQTLMTKRKAMNTWLCSTERRIVFVGRMNEDATTYTVNGRRGKLYLTHFLTIVCPFETQSIAGGMTELYADNGTYWKTFYTICQAPSCTKVGILMCKVQHRIHHEMSWNNLCPKILREEHGRTSSKKVSKRKKV